MNTERKLIEDFKRSASSETMAKVRFNMVLPTNYANLDYHGKIRAERVATDNAIAAHLGLTVSDNDTWPEEQSQILAKEWAAGLPDA